MGFPPSWVTKLPIFHTGHYARSSRQILGGIAEEKEAVSVWLAEIIFKVLCA